MSDVDLSALGREPVYRSALADAEAAGLSVAIRDLGAWGDRVRPCAELDTNARRIVLDRSVLMAAFERRGSKAAAALAAAAIAHELAHDADPETAETEIRRRVDVAAGKAWDADVRALFEARR